MTEVIKILVLLVAFSSHGLGQITIDGREGNVVYSSVVNTIRYTGMDDCTGLTAKIEGLEKERSFVDCKFEITGLIQDTSGLVIKNNSGAVLFDTLLIKNKNRATAYLHIGDGLFLEGSINKKNLGKAEGIRVKYACPWIEEPKIYGFHLIITEKSGAFRQYEISGGRIPKRIRDEISGLKEPNRIYIEQINWVPIGCFESINGIVMDIK